MSLLGVWRDRKQVSVGPTRPPALWKLVAAFAIVVALIWQLTKII